MVCLSVEKHKEKSFCFFFEGIRLPHSYPYPSFFSFRGSHLLRGQDLDVISIPFQKYFIQVTTTRF